MTSPDERVIAVVPAFNEEATIGAVVKGLLSYVAEVIVVDDCSHDESGARAEAAGGHVLQQQKNGGYDNALNRGFAEAMRRGATIIITFDADGEHDATDVPRVLLPIQNGTADISIGQRPLVRHWGERIFATYTKLRFGIADPLCGMKAYRREVYEKVGFFDSVRSIGTELTIRGLRKGFRLATVPAVLHPRSGTDGSRFYSMNVRGNLNVLRALWSILFI